MGNYFYALPVFLVLLLAFVTVTVVKKGRKQTAANIAQLANPVFLGIARSIKDEPDRWEVASHQHNSNPLLHQDRNLTVEIGVSDIRIYTSFVNGAYNSAEGMGVNGGIIAAELKDIWRLLEIKRKAAASRTSPARAIRENIYGKLKIDVRANH